MLQKVSCYNRG